MTEKVLWSMINASAEIVPSLKRGCENDSGTLRTKAEPGGNFTATCVIDANPSAAGATFASSTHPAVPVVHAVAPVDPTRRDVDPGHLHPAVRAMVAAVQERLDAETIPMKMFEGFRTPERQAHLYAKGRTTAGDRVTNANAWQSYHQYGLAADFVRYENGKPTWETGNPTQRAHWERFQAIARECGLEPLTSELSHVQLPDHSLTQLMNGDYPEGGDESWSGNLVMAISGWVGGGAPPFPDDTPRPALALAAASTPATAGGSQGWHSKFGGDAWAYDEKGVYTRDHLGQLKLWRTAGAPITVQEVIARHGDAIRAASARHGVSRPLIVMTIATETALYRKDGFTGPRTFRWEQGFVVGATGNPDYDGKEAGDYSAGPMQVMSDTARWMNDRYSLGHDKDAMFPFFKNRPSKPPASLGLYLPEVCIDVGAAYIRHNMAKTGDDPLLVAAAYNAGGLYPSKGNHWRIRAYGDHIDRAAEWFGDACFVLEG